MGEHICTVYTPSLGHGVASASGTDIHGYKVSCLQQLSKAQMAIVGKPNFMFGFSNIGHGYEMRCTRHRDTGNSRHIRGELGATWRNQESKARDDE